MWFEIVALATRKSGKKTEKRFGPIVCVVLAAKCGKKPPGLREISRKKSWEECSRFVDVFFSEGGCCNFLRRGS